MAIADGRLITMYQTTDGQHCVAYSATTGERQWQTTVARYYKNQMGNGPRATPLIAGNHVFVFTGDGILACLQTVDGKEVWKEDCMARFKSKVADYGMASSPVIAGNNVVVTVGASSATVAAFDAKSGKLAWTSGSGAAAGYSSPAVRKVADHDELLVFHGGGAAGLDPATGQQIWSYPYKTDYDCNIATPIVTPSGVLISAGENHGSVMLKVGTKTSSRPSAVWESVGVKSVLRSEWQTPILLNGYIYGMDNVGSAGPVTNLACVEARSGKQVWLKRRFGKGNLIAADGLLVISTMKGELVLVEASPEGFKELGRGNYVGQTRQAPALSNGMVYLRDDADIVCLDLRAQK